MAGPDIEPLMYQSMNSRLTVPYINKVNQHDNFHVSVRDLMLGLESFEIAEFDNW